MIALIDCNNFYCSCEQVFQPELRNRAMIVLSNNDGCAISRSEEARALGIKMGTPHFMITRLLEEKSVQVQSSNYTLYGDMSERVMQVIGEFVQRLEIYSIDEVFADLSGMPYVDLEQYGREIREAVARCTGIPVTVGIARTKTLAKMANRFAKERQGGAGVFVAASNEQLEQMRLATPVEEVWGIGKEFAALLRGQGFTTAASLAEAPEEWVRKNMSVVGQRLLNELKGISCIAWETGEKAKKNICTARSFGKLVQNKNELRQAVAKFTATCAEKLRKEKTCARKLHLFIQTNPHRHDEPQYFQSVTQELTVPTSNTPELIRKAMAGLDLIYQPGYKFQKAGVMMLDLVPETLIQMGLFDQENRKRDQALMKTVDAVNRSFGRDMVRFGVQDYEEGWKLRQEHLSQHYTTRLDQIPKAG